MSDRQMFPILRFLTPTIEAKSIGSGKARKNQVVICLTDKFTSLRNDQIDKIKKGTPDTGFQFATSYATTSTNLPGRPTGNRLDFVREL